VRERVEALHEFNPMLGFRGVRLAIAYPEIAEMQARAIFEAALAVGRKTGNPVMLEMLDREIHITVWDEARILLIGNYVEVRSEIVLQEFLLKEFELIGSNASAGASASPP